MKKRILSALLVVVCILSLTGCGVSGKYVNTKKSGSYIELDAGSTESSGKGYARNVYTYNTPLTGLLKYSDGKATIRVGRIDYTFTRSQISVNKVAKSITFMGYTYKK